MRSPRRRRRRIWCGGVRGDRSHGKGKRRDVTEAGEAREVVSRWSYLPSYLLTPSYFLTFLPACLVIFCCPFDLLAE